MRTILKWYAEDRDKKQFVTLGGYAGTGKTTLIAALRKELSRLDSKLKVGFASYTGKASRVLLSKLKEAGVVLSQDTVGTIHSLIYSPIVNAKEEIIGWKLKDKIDRALIIIDEASMVDQDIWSHLLSYKVPIVAVGDHGQLPPIRGNFNLVGNPELRLEEIYRQARENPIIGLSIQAREHGMVRVGEYGSGVAKYLMDTPESQELLEGLLNSYDYDTLVMCGYNKTRVRLNARIRELLGFESPAPVPGDRVICLRNNHQKNIYNGMLGTINTIEPVDEDWYSAEIKMDNESREFRGLVSISQFNSESGLNFTGKRRQIMKGDLFDFGYAITVHKAQGSQARRVILIEERFRKMTEDEWRRWLYTAVTRAEEELYIFALPLSFK